LAQPARTQTIAIATDRKDRVRRFISGTSMSYQKRVERFEMLAATRKAALVQLLWILTGSESQFAKSDLILRRTIFMRLKFAQHG
jgi:hypothetical protein